MGRNLFFSSSIFVTFLFFLCFFFRAWGTVDKMPTFLHIYGRCWNFKICDSWAFDGQTSLIDQLSEIPWSQCLPLRLCFVNAITALSWQEIDVSILAVETVSKSRPACVLLPMYIINYSKSCMLLPFVMRQNVSRSSSSCMCRGYF